MILKGIKSEITVKVTAEVEGDNGRITKVPFVCKYRKPSVQETKDIVRRLQTDDLTDDELIPDYLIDWAELVDDNGDKIVFDTDNLSQVMDVREYRRAIVQGFMSVLFGKQALIKN